jgi:hypothetical protein
MIVSKEHHGRAPGGNETRLAAWTSSSQDATVQNNAHEQAEQTIHQHPLAYLLGLEGVALMRAFAGEHGRSFTEARFAEIRRLLDLADDLGPGVDVGPVPVGDGYDGWRRPTTVRTTGASRCATMC